jgi:hypothetical protein
MNEQIKKIAMQSQLVYETTDGKLYNSWEDYVDLTEYVEKFGELIVRECRQVVNVEIETNCKPSEEWGRDDWEQGYVAGMWAATRFMKAHFGIEEYERTN